MGKLFMAEIPIHMGWVNGVIFLFLFFNHGFSCGIRVTLNFWCVLMLLKSVNLLMLSGNLLCLLKASDG